MWPQRGLCGNNKGAALQQRGWGHASVIPPNDVLHSLQCPQVPHAHKSVMIQGYRQHKDLLLPSTHKPVAPAAGAHQTSKLQNRPLWTAPLLHHPFPKVETTDTELTALPLGIPTSHPHAQPWERLGFFWLALLPSIATFLSSTTSQGATPPALPMFTSQPQSSDAWWEAVAAKPSEGQGPAQWDGVGATVGGEEQELRGQGEGSG